MTNPAVFHQRHTATLIPASYVPEATSLHWLDGDPIFTSLTAERPVRAVVLDQYAQIMDGLTPNYSSASSAIASIAADGMATAVGNGTTTLSADYNPGTGPLPTITRTATVAQVAVSITGVPPTLDALTGDAGTITPVVRDALGQAITGAVCGFATRDPGIATLSGAGAWSIVAAGSTVFTITYGSLSVTCEVDATAAADLTPVLSGIDVSSMTQGDSGGTITLSGDHIDANVTAVWSGTGVTWTGVTRTATTLTLTGVAIADTATVGDGTFSLHSTTHGDSVGTVTFTVVAGLTLDTDNAAPVVGDAFTLTPKWRGVAITPDSLTTSAPTIVSIDPPTLSTFTGNVVQGDSSVTHAITGLNLRTGQTLTGLPTGVTATPITATSPTTGSVSVSAAADAALGDAVLALDDATHGASAPGPAMTVVAASGGTTGALAVTGGNFSLLAGGYQVLDITDGTNPVTGCTITPADPTVVDVVSGYMVRGKQGAGHSTTLTISKTGYTDAVVTVTGTSTIIEDLSTAAGLDQTSDGAAIGSLTDQSGSGHAYVQATVSKKPTLNKHAFSGAGGQSVDVLTFASASQQNLTTAATVPALSVPSVTIVRVVANGVDAPAGSQRHYEFWDGTHFEGFHLTHTAGGTECDVNFGNGAARTVVVESAALSVASGLHCIIDSLSAAGVTTYVDGVAGATGAPVYARPTTAPPVSSIGSDKGTGNYADLKWAMQRQYNTALNATERAQLMLMIRTEYGTP